MTDLPASPSTAPQTGRVESRSIDWVTLSERGGTARSLFPLWFMANANITTLATGMLGAVIARPLLDAPLPDFTA